MRSHARPVVMVINADDYGYNECIDRGIIELIQNGRINSVSVIVNGSNILNATEKLKDMINKYPIL